MIEAAMATIRALRLGDWLAMLSGVIAVASFVLSRATVRRQQAMQIEGFRRQRDDALVAWASDAIGAIADAQRHCRDIKNGLIGGDDERRAASALRTRLSVLLDTGRLFFPNFHGNDGDEDGRAVSPSEAAYAGDSHSAIGALYAVYRVISDLGREGGLAPADAVAAVVAGRRAFVSEVFRSIDPRRREAAFAALTGKG